MTEKEFINIAKALKSVYADPKFISDQFAMEIWFKQLADIPYDIATMAIQKYIQVEKFPPTIADIRYYAREITSPASEDMSEVEAWSLVRRAINNGLYGAEKEFERLPKIIQSVLGSPERIRSMATLEPSDIETVEQSHFIRAYRARSEAHKRQKQLNEGLRTAIGSMRQQAEDNLRISEQNGPAGLIEAETSAGDPFEGYDEYEIPEDILDQLHVLIYH